MILYIAGPMSGIPEHNYPAFHAAERDLTEAGYDVLSPARIDEAEGTQVGEQPWEWYMRRSLRMLTHADALALLPGWKHSKGASIETALAAQLGMRARSVGMWVEGAPRAEVNP